MPRMTSTNNATPTMHAMTQSCTTPVSSDFHILLSLPIVGPPRRLIEAHHLAGGALTGGREAHEVYPGGNALATVVRSVPGRGRRSGRDRPAQQRPDDPAPGVDDLEPGV